MMNMGEKIRMHRLRRSMTQERLSQSVGVTAQAVSKWESGQSYPDITLLPELAAVLGVSIDELFESSQEQHLTRIEAMLENEVMLSREDFDYAMNRAQEIARTKHNHGRCLTLMSELSMQRARGYMNMAAEYAKQALAVEPEKKVNHALLGDAMQGCKCDWCCTNHSELIDYYFDFLQAHPEDTLGRMYLLDNLIDDGRLEEAERELAALKGTPRRGILCADVRGHDCAEARRTRTGGSLFRRDDKDLRG